MEAMVPLAKHWASGPTNKEAAKPVIFKMTHFQAKPATR